MANVTAKPRTKPVPIQTIKKQLMSVVILLSLMDGQALINASSAEILNCVHLLILLSTVQR